MPGGDKLRADAVGLGEQIFELCAWVADYAGVRRLAAQIRFRERAAHVALKLGLDVQHRQRHADEFCRVYRALPRGLVGVVHIQAVHLMSGLFQKHGGYSGVHSAGKAENDLAHLPPSM